MNLGENVSHLSFHGGTRLTLHSTIGALDLPLTPQKSKWVGTHLLPPLCGDALIDLKTGKKREPRGQENSSQPNHDRSRKTSQEGFRTEDDLATVKYADEFIPRGLVMVDLQELWGSVSDQITSGGGSLTLLCEHEEPFAPVLFGYVQVLFLYPSK